MRHSVDNISIREKGRINILIDVSEDFILKQKPNRENLNNTILLIPDQNE